MNPTRKRNFIIFWSCILLVAVCIAHISQTDATALGQTVMQKQANGKKLEIDVAEHRAGELVFTFSIDAFISAYNSDYQQDHHSQHLASSDAWRTQRLDVGIHSNHPTIWYHFTADETNWTLPTLSVYVPSDCDAVQEITIDYDDHSYTEATYARYEELCFDTLRIFFPDLDEQTLTELYQTLNRLAYQNLMPHEQGYRNGAIPCALYYKDGIGLYPYFAEGESMHLCIIPVTAQTLAEFQQKGVAVSPIGEDQEDASEDASIDASIDSSIDATIEDTASTNEPFPNDQRQWVTQRCQQIADICRPTYQSADWEPSRYMPDQLVLSQQSIDAIEEKLIDCGYTVLDTDSTYPAFLQNADGMYAFWDAVQKGEAGRQDYIWISPYGGFHLCLLEHRTDGSYVLEAEIQWDAQQTPEVTALYQQEVLDWELTENGNFYYKLYAAHSPAFEDYTLLRLREPDHQLWDLSAKYIEPVGYQNHNLFSCSWRSAYDENLCLNDLLEFFYRAQTGRILDPNTLQYQENPFYYQIPAATFEAAILPYFDMTLQQLRAKCCYDQQTNTYPWLDVAYDNLSYYPLITGEVKACQQNKDGTITLTVDAMCVGKKLDSLFRHQLTIRPKTNGSFQYISNTVLSTSEELPPYQPRLQMQRT